MDPVWPYREDFRSHRMICESVSVHANMRSGPEAERGHRPTYFLRFVPQAVKGSQRRYVRVRQTSPMNFITPSEGSIRTSWPALRNGYCTNRKGHCGGEGRGDTLLNLTPKEASRICMDQCRAMCCRGPLILRLEPEEVAVFHREAVHLGTTADISPAADGGGDLLFLDHPGECCPMLDQATLACRIYEQRPRVCREFPRRPEPGCAISGWTDD